MARVMECLLPLPLLRCSGPQRGPPRVDASFSTLRSLIWQVEAFRAESNALHLKREAEHTDVLSAAREAQAAAEAQLAEEVREWALVSSESSAL